MNKFFHSLILAGCLITINNHSGNEKCDGCKNPVKCLSNIFVDTVKNSRQSVVYIETKYGKQKLSKESTQQRNNYDQFDQFQDDLLQRFFGQPRGYGEEQRGRQIGSGTGFIVSDDGFIVTNHHLIKDATEIVVEMYADSGDKQYSAELVGCDPRTDIAILKIEGKGLPYLIFSDSDKIEQGQMIVAIGHPLRLRDSVTVGVISAKHRKNLEIADIGDFIQIDAGLSSGNSGGPLLNIDGEVVGVNTAIIPPSSRNMGVGFSVPSNIAKMVYEHVKATGTVNRGYLGVSVQDLTADLIEGFGLKKNTKGALVSDVAKNSSGLKAGLKSGDIVIEFDSMPIKSVKNFQIEVGKLPAGKKCQIKIFRDGKQMMLTAELGSHMPQASISGDIIHKLGVIVEEIAEGNGQKHHLKTGETGVVIKEVVEGSIAHRSGWKEGSVIRTLNGMKISSVKDLEKALESSSKKKKIVALLSHNGSVLFSSLSVE